MWGAFCNGRSKPRSIRAPIAYISASENTIEAPISQPSLDWVRSTANAPTMKNSPWQKFTTVVDRNSTVMPSAIRV